MQVAAGLVYTNYYTFSTYQLQFGNIHVSEAADDFTYFPLQCQFYYFNYKVISHLQFEGYIEHSGSRPLTFSVGLAHALPL